MSRRSLLIASSLVLGSVTTASAGSYVSLGIGGDPALQGEVREAASGEGDGGNGRLALGLGAGRLSIEASLSRFGLPLDEALAAGAHLRLGLPIDGGFGAYGRLGVERVWLGDNDQMLGDTEADGIVGALGLEYKLEAPLLGEAGIWAEVSQDRFETERGTGGVRLWTLGLMLGL